jgi:hypothetical protein
MANPILVTGAIGKPEQTASLWPDAPSLRGLLRKSLP